MRLIGREEEGSGPDWALVQLDRPVTNHQSVRIRRTGKIPENQEVHVIGHPVGIPISLQGGQLFEKMTKMLILLPILTHMAAILVHLSSTVILMK